jgi:hypothetical protein
MRKALFGLVFLPLVACVGQTPPARAQEAANDLNTNQRFGRMELVAERIAEPSREKFFEHRKGWGTRIQIADSEMLGLKMKGDDEAEVMLRVAWYKIDEGDLHATTLKQSWKDFRGSWKLTGEDRTDGDVGLFGDAPEASASAKTAVAAPAVQQKKNTRFATIRLSTGDAPPPQLAPEEEAKPAVEGPSEAKDDKPAPAKAEAPVPAAEPAKPAGEPTKPAPEPAKP